MTPGSRRIEFTAGSRIPFKTRSEMYPTLGDANILARSGRHPGKALLFAEGRFFHDLQVAASYKSNEHWNGFVLKRGPELLPRTRARLRNHESLKLVVLGDSISAGSGASGVFGAKPFRPGYPGLVAQGMEARGASKVSLTNLSVGGMTSSWGVTRIPAVIVLEPNLVLVAFGMNDESGPFAITAKRYGQHIRQMVDTTLKALPACEIILVAPMLGNPEWDSLDHARLPAFRNELLDLEAPGVAVADVTLLWGELLKRKSYYDLTGNVLNHPNDFGHTFYAQVILDLLSP